MEEIAQSSITTIQGELLSWWHSNRRDLPWRQTRDPYRIMVAEIMLQQTQVDRVVPYYHLWFDSFPTIEDLATAPTADVIRLWAGLGYNRRAINLQRAAQAIMDDGGDFPSTVEALLKLPGIGPYTAGAIACFAFEKDTAFIDTNIRRVLHRLFVGAEIPKPSISDRELIALAADVLPPGNAWNWNQGLIEFGALQCTARKPHCIACPLQPECKAFPEIQLALAGRPGASRGMNPLPFEQTNRYFRGRVMQALRHHDGDGVPISDLGTMLRPTFDEEDVPWLLEIVQGLEKDGLAAVAEEEAAYDVSRIRIRLP